MKSIIAAVFAIAMGVLVSGCASGAGTPSAGNGSTASSSGSGVTVFGTVDASVSGYSTRSERR